MHSACLFLLKFLDQRWRQSHVQQMLVHNACGDTPGQTRGQPKKSALLKENINLFPFLSLLYWSEMYRNYSSFYNCLQTKFHAHLHLPQHAPAKLVNRSKLSYFEISDCMCRYGTVSSVAPLVYRHFAPLLSFLFLKGFTTTGLLNLQSSQTLLATTGVGTCTAVGKTRISSYWSRNLRQCLLDLDVDGNKKVTGRGGLCGCETSRFPQFQTISPQMAVRLALRSGCPLPPGRLLVLISARG